MRRNINRVEATSSRNDLGGKPTGLLQETASGLVRKHLPEPNAAEVYAALRYEMQRAAAFGLTSLQLASGINDAERSAFERALADPANAAYPVDEVDRAVVLLQRLIRGRAVQNLFFEGRERCRGLICELQAAASTISAEVATAADVAAPS